jgi:hypothetical protein
MGAPQTSSTGGYRLRFFLHKSISISSAYRWHHAHHQWCPHFRWSTSLLGQTFWGREFHQTHKSQIQFFFSWSMVYDSRQVIFLWLSATLYLILLRTRFHKVWLPSAFEHSSYPADRRGHYDTGDNKVTERVLHTYYGFSIGVSMVHGRHRKFASSPTIPHKTLNHIRFCDHQGTPRRYIWASQV